MLPWRAAGPAATRVHRAVHLRNCFSAAAVFGVKPLGSAEAAGVPSQAPASPAAHAQQHVALIPKPKRLVVLAAHPAIKKKKLKVSKGPASPVRSQTRQHSITQQKNSVQQQQGRQQQQKYQLEEPQQRSEATQDRSPQQQMLQHSTQQQSQQVRPQNRARQQERQHQSKHLQQQTQGSKAGQSTFNQQGQHARQQQQQYSASNMQPAAAKAAAVQETTDLLAAAKIDVGDTGNASKRAASIHFKLPQHAYREFRAAGVVMYDYDTVNGQPASTRLLLVRELGQVWCLPAGKLSKPLDGTLRPELTAARELEEETHGLIPARVSKAVLSECPQYYWRDGKMVLYFVRCTGGDKLPDMASARLAAGRAHPAAKKIDQLAWVSLDKIMSGSGARGLETRLKKASAAAAAAAAPALAGTKSAAAEHTATQSPDPTTIPAPSTSLLGSATVQQQAGNESGDVGSDVSQQGHPPQQQQKQGRDDTGRLMLRPTLVVTKAEISRWLEVLVTGAVEAPAIVIKPLQQEEGLPPAVDWLRDPVVEAARAARPAPAAIGVKAGSSGAAGADAAGRVSTVFNAATAASAATAAAFMQLVFLQVAAEGHPQASWVISLGLCTCGVANMKHGQPRCRTLRKMELSRKRV